MEYFIWNNTDSRNVKGLIVCGLPPITKPKMRTQVLALDGRDGSIITNLGFSAYQKKVKIGLTKGYDIDNIIAWFNGAGQIVFSNEPDKYYNAQIIENIDFDKLLRFKTAEITFEVQPFKYSTIERQKTFNTAGLQQIKVVNTGNYNSKPTMTIYGSGTINFYLNGAQQFTLALNENDTITLDSTEQEAFNETGLRNRIMNGNFIVLKQGTNTLSWDGTITKIEISKYSRWL